MPPLPLSLPPPAFTPPPRADASKQIIQLNSICSVVRNDVSELLGGALGGPALDGLEKRWLKETLANSRDEDEVRLGFYRTKALLS